jgi:predicted AlkP superfamily phosphohydrolase/phosphomutase
LEKHPPAGRDGRVLMIGLDAAEVTLVTKWIEDGSLPNLRALRQRGAFGPLASSADWLSASPWPTFYTGTPPEEHGLYRYLVWRPETMTSERPSPDWLPLQPFWRRLGEAGRRVVAIDVPLTYPPEPFDGVEISGWATHEILLRTGAHPPDLLREVYGRFGNPPFGVEPTYPLRADELLRIRDQWLETIRLVGDLGTALARERPWDLFLICFCAAHRCGHQLWDLTQMIGPASAHEVEAVRGALKEIYVACDGALGRLVETAGPETTVLVFALHGMGENQSRSDLLPEMLRRVLAGPGAPALGRLVRIAEPLRQKIPLRWRHGIKRHLPMAVQDRLTLFWRSGGIDWRSAPAFAMYADVEGHIRINLRGREAQGWVAPGPECEALCRRIEDGLRSFVDEDTGEPVVEAIARGEDLFGSGARRASLPDLIVRWAPSAAARHRRIVSPDHGDIDWPTPGRHMQGRSGNHRGTGFLLAAGGRIAPGARLARGHILDLAPTAYALLDLPVPTEFRGRPLFWGQ